MGFAGFANSAVLCAQMAKNAVKKPVVNSVITSENITSILESITDFPRSYRLQELETIIKKTKLETAIYNYIQEFKKSKSVRYLELYNNLKDDLTVNKQRIFAVHAFVKHRPESLRILQHSCDQVLEGDYVSKLQYTHPQSLELIFKINKSVYLDGLKDFKSSHDINHFYCCLRAISKAKAGELLDKNVPVYIKSKKWSLQIYELYAEKKYPKLIEQYKKHQNVDTTAFSNVLDSYSAIRLPLEGLENFIKYCSKLKSFEMQATRFMLNNALKLTGFKGYSHYSEIIFLHYFEKLNVDPSFITNCKLVQSLSISNENYPQFWTEFGNKKSITWQNVQKMFSFTSTQMTDILLKRNAILRPFLNYDRVIPSSLGASLAYFLHMAQMHNREGEFYTYDAGAIGILMRSCNNFGQPVASIRLFSIFHQWNESECHSNHFLDPFTGKLMHLDFHIFDPVYNGTLNDKLLFGKKNLQDRNNLNPPSWLMMDQCVEALKSGNWLSKPIMHQLNQRKFKSQGFKYRPSSHDG
eukprot:NODE_12_length_54577_cov_0.384100.p7 type:complete len:525 gc:universal NODE_12_length_54577_cov_0.384100:10581-9007(-)